MAKIYNFPREAVPKRYGFWFKEVRSELKVMWEEDHGHFNKSKWDEIIMLHVFFRLAYICSPLLTLVIRNMFYKEAKTETYYTFDNPDCIKELDALQKAYDVLNN